MSFARAASIVTAACLALKITSPLYVSITPPFSRTSLRLVRLRHFKSAGCQLYARLLVARASGNGLQATWQQMILIFAWPTFALVLLSRGNDQSPCGIFIHSPRLQNRSAPRFLGRAPGLPTLAPLANGSPEVSANHSFIRRTLKGCASFTPLFAATSLLAADAFTFPIKIVPLILLKFYQWISFRKIPYPFYNRT